MDGEGASRIKSSPYIRDLIARLYDAVLVPARWPTVLGDVAMELNCGVSGVVIHDLRTNRVRMPVSTGISAPFVTAFEERFGVQNVWLPRCDRFRRAGVVYIGADLVDDTTLTASEFYKGWLQPQELHHSLVGAIGGEGDEVQYVFAFRYRREPGFESTEAAELQRLLPHFERSIRLQREVSRLEQERLAHFEALSEVPVPLVNVDGSGRVLAVNRAARDIIGKRDGLRWLPPRLEGNTIQDSAALRDLISRAAATNGADQPARWVGSVSLSRVFAPTPLRADVVAARPQGGLFFDVPKPSVFIVLSDPEQKRVKNEESLQRLYGLTPREAGLALMVADGLPVGDIAKNIGIAIGTARVHLQRIFDKTGVRRQAELVHLILSGGSEDDGV